MSNVNYNLKRKGIRVIDTKEAWVVKKNGQMQFNKKFNFVGKVEMTMPNLIVSTSDKRKPI